MTLWSLITVFSRPVAESTSASFDPTWTSAPLAPTVGDPVAGFGQTSLPADVAMTTRRHPIGFAPPEEAQPDTRFRTEISFRRHRDVPSASALPSEHAGASGLPAWETAGRIDVVPEEPVPSASTLEHDDVVPFYRREIRFRRRKGADATVDAAPTEHGVHDGVALGFALDTSAAHERLEEDESEVFALGSPADESVKPELELEPAADAPPVEASVPFYKREIGFGRKRRQNEQVDAVEDPADELVGPVTVSDEPAVDDVEVEPPIVSEPPRVEASVPFYKREIGFVRPNDVHSERTDDFTESDLENGDPFTDVELVAHGDEAPTRDDVSDTTPGESERDLADIWSKPESEEPVADHTDAPETASNESVVEHTDGVAAWEPLSEDRFSAHAVAAESDSGEPAAEPNEVEEPPASSLPEPEARWRDPADALVGEEAPFGEHEPPAAEEPTGSLESHDVEAVEDASSETIDTGSTGAEETSSVAEEPATTAFERANADAILADNTSASDIPVAGADEDEPAKKRRSGGGREKASRKRFQRPSSGKSRSVVGLKIGASQIAAAVVAQTNAGNELLDLTRRSLEAGIVVDGEVRDETALASALKAFFDDHKLPRSDVWIGLSSNRIGVRTIDMPAIDDKAQFDNAVRFKAHEVLPVALSESVLDYRVLSEYVDENAKRFCRVLLAVAPRDQVEPYQRVAEQAGLKLAGADLEALGLLRAFVAPRSADNPADTATVVVSIGHESSTLLVAGAGACEFTRVFDWGGNVLLEAIASTLEVRPAEAATMLRHLSLAGPGRQYDPLDESGRARATEAVRQRLTPFARELVNSLQFYQTQAGSLGIGEILITGGTSHLEGVDAVLQQMIGVGVQIGDPFARVIRGADLDPAIESSIGSLAVPIGLALHDDLSRGVNLLPRELARKRDTRSLAMAVGLPVAALIPLAALALTYTGAHGRVSDRQSQLDAIEAQIAALPKPTKPVIAAGVATDEATRATAVASVLGGRLTWESVFSDLGRILPENVWLTNLTLTAPDGTAITAPPPPGGATTPTGVQMQGFTYSQPDVALLLARLATVPSLQRVTLTSSLQQPLGSRKVVHFVIVADLNQTGGAS